MANDLRIGGLISGMDTQAEIDKIMKYSRAPLDRLKQKQQMLIWKQEAYRTQNTALTKLRDLLTNLKLTGTYQTKTANSTNTNVATATANSKASGSYRIHVDKLAESAHNQSVQALSVRTMVTGGRISGTVNFASDESFTINVDGGESKNITISAGSYTASQLAASIQVQLLADNFDDPVNVKVTAEGNLVFYSGLKSNGEVRSITLNGSALTTMGFVDGANSKEITGSAISSGTVLVNSSNNRYRIAVGASAVQEFTLPDGSYSLADIASFMETQIRTLGGEYAEVGVTVTDANELKFSYLNPADPDNAQIKLSPGSSNDILQELGFGAGAISDARNNIDPTKSLWNERDKFVNSSYIVDEHQAFAFVINGQAFSFSYQDSLNKIIAEINGNSAAGVTAYYDGFNDKLMLTSNAVGDNNEGGAEIQLSDTNGVLRNLFGIDQANETGGANAELTINGSSIQQKDNTFTFNNITFNLAGLGDTTVTIGSNTEEVTKKVKEFIDKYNEIIEVMNTEVNETRATSGSKYKFYEPLTDEQRKAMSEDQIKAWEEKAKEGILHNNSLLSDAIREMRTGLSRIVSNPVSITGVPIADTVDLTGANKLKVTFNGVTKEITIDEASYNRLELGNALQKEFDLTFGTGAIKVGVTGSGALKFTTNNIGFTFNDADSQNGLSQLGLSNGATVKAGYSSLSQIGITTGYYTENGKLNFDEEKFAAAMAENPESAIRLLTNYEEPNLIPINDSDDWETKKTATAENNIRIAQAEASKGIFYKLYEVIQQSNNKIADMAGSVGTVNGSSLGQELSRIGDKISSVQDRLTMEEDRLWSQFSAMEQMLSNLNSQSAYLSSILGMSSGG